MGPDHARPNPGVFRVSAHRIGPQRFSPAAADATRFGPRPPDPRPAAPHAASAAPDSTPGTADIKRWRQYLADERAEAAVYRDLAQNRVGEERAILLALAEAEGRHEAHCSSCSASTPARTGDASLRSRFLGFLARHFGSVFVLALAQRAESRSPYASDPFATPAMVADEQIHEEVVRGLATRGRNRLAGTFRAAVFGANDGLVSNLSLVMGMAASGVGSSVVLLSGVAGLLAGALSMGAGEFISVRSQRELLAATRPTQITLAAAPLLDIEHNELLLVYLAGGMSREAAEHRVAERMGLLDCDCDPACPCARNCRKAKTSMRLSAPRGERRRRASASSPRARSCRSFRSCWGMTGLAALVVSATLVGLALLLTGSVVGLLSGTSPTTRGLRQLAIGMGAAVVTYLLGMAFGAVIG